MGIIVDEYSGKEIAALTVHLQGHLCLSAKEVVELIKNKFDVEYTLSRVTNLLHRLGFSSKKAKAIPGKAKKLDQELFILEFYRLKREGKINFMDSTHPEHNSVISYGWIKKG